ncbi:hypothetical protein CEXT_242551 [Caerostris extrusa]|uniref:Uncharacterized protein n=1 Tax=Caerostris extrusa TaxID=172846 RepID=A0AAV4XTT6_CAEEX|nr:hypothetical protein CEXT_242551 [Caerostris extrusa]
MHARNIWKKHTLPPPFSLLPQIMTSVLIKPPKLLESDCLFHLSPLLAIKKFLISLKEHCISKEAGSGVCAMLYLKINLQEAKCWFEVIKNTPLKIVHTPNEKGNGAMVFTTFRVPSNLNCPRVNFKSPVLTLKILSPPPGVVKIGSYLQLYFPIWIIFDVIMLWIQRVCNGSHGQIWVTQDLASAGENGVVPLCPEDCRYRYNRLIRLQKEFFSGKTTDGLRQDGKARNLKTQMTSSNVLPAFWESIRVYDTYLMSDWRKRGYRPIALITVALQTSNTCFSSDDSVKQTNRIEFFRTKLQGVPDEVCVMSCHSMGTFPSYSFGVTRWEIGILQRSCADKSLHSVVVVVVVVVSLMEGGKRDKDNLQAIVSSCRSQTAVDKSWNVLRGPHFVPDSPRAVAVAMFRLLTGHYCLRAYLIHFNFI